MGVRFPPPPLISMFMLRILEAVFVGFALILDLIEILEDIISSTIILIFLKIFGTVLETSFNIVLFFFFLIFALLEGTNMTYRKTAFGLITYILGALTEYMPFLDILPIRTVTLIIAFWLFNKDYVSAQKKEKELSLETEKEVEGLF